MSFGVCGCGLELELPDNARGQSFTCPQCNAVLYPAAGGSGADYLSSRLTIVTGPDRVGEQFLLGGDAPIIAGKLPDNVISLIAPKVSRVHCQLVRTPDGGWQVEDRKSTNGLFVNQKRVASQALNEGDVIRIGDYGLRFSTGVDADAAPIEMTEEIAPPPPAKSSASIVETGDAPDDLYDLAEPAPPPATRAPAAMIGAMNAPPKPVGPPPVCPSCKKTLAPGAKICVPCGIDINTGRPLVTSRDIDEDALAIRADTWIRIVSWLIPFGLFPIASEAFGTRKPRVTWGITIVTVIASALFLIAAISAGEEDMSVGLQNMMLWAGDEEGTKAELAKLFEEESEPAVTAKGKPAAAGNKPDAKKPSLTRELQAELQSLMDEMPRFHWYQLLTHALLHAGIMHLAGNLLFLLVFGMRVNELIGNLLFWIVYPVLAIIAGIAHMISAMHDTLHPMLGASGAIMGLAGMYFVFFPIQKVHMAIWFRGGMLTRWQCFYKVFAMRGFWLLVMWIGFNDVLPVVLGDKGGVAHWAHLGGFLGGAAIALALLLSRKVKTYGGDILSVALGKRAWALLGKPGDATALPANVSV